MAKDENEVDWWGVILVKSDQKTIKLNESGNGNDTYIVVHLGMQDWTSAAMAVLIYIIVHMF
jgi:hypothetical protein